MTLLILGLALWWAAHLFKRIAPEARAKLGDPGKGAVALAVVASVVLMVIGYRMADGPVWWGRSSALVGINNLLMVVAFLLFGAGSVGSTLSKRMRHPMLTGFKLWAVAHLLVNGDLASLVLFGGLLAWAVVEVIVINRTSDWAPDRTARFGRRDAILAVVWLAVMVVAMLIHHWLGYTPWG